MQIVKKHILNIICGVVAILALVALVWPISGWYTDLAAQAQTAGKASADIQSLMSSKRVKPIFSDRAQEGAQGEPLERFPNREIIDDANQAMSKVKDQAEAARQAAISINRTGHDLLYFATLPEAGRPDLFVAQYAAVMTTGKTPIPSDPSNPKVVPENIPDTILHSAAPPTNEQINLGLKDEWDKKYQPLVYLRQDPTTGAMEPFNQPAILAQFRNEMKNYPEKYRHDMATKYSVYLDANALMQAPHMKPEAEGGQMPSVESMWYAQMNVWVQQDLARAVREMNTFRDRADPNKLRPSAGGSPAPEDPAAAAAQTKQPKVYNGSPTGRACGPMYDVVHSTLTAVVAQNAVEDLIRTLQSGRMITVLQVADEKKIDNALAADLGYDYGPSPVVQVKIKCEHLFMRDWTARGPKAPMPPEVRKKLGVTDQPQQGTPAGGPPNTVALTR